MNVRTKIAELTTNVHSQLELDVLVAQHGNLGNLFRAEFPGADGQEFMYEWESMKLKIGGRMTREG